MYVCITISVYKQHNYISTAGYWSSLISTVDSSYLLVIVQDAFQNFLEIADLKQERTYVEVCIENTSTTTTGYTEPEVQQVTQKEKVCYVMQLMNTYYLLIKQRITETYL